MKSVPDQFELLRPVFPDVTLTAIDGLQLVTLPSVKLPPGWSKQYTRLRFVVPNGYPYAPPDCFWADFDLRLENGQMPQNVQIGVVAPGQPDSQTLWFSWHVNPVTWKPSTCDLMTYVKIIRQRFEERQ